MNHKAFEAGLLFQLEFPGEFTEEPSGGQRSPKCTRCDCRETFQ